MECFLLQFTLKGYACQRPIRAEILWTNPDEQRAIGIFPIACKIAHPIGNQPALFAGSCNHLAPWAHAKRIHAPAAGKVNR